MDKGFPKGGGGGSDVWEKFPNNIVFFFLRAYLIIFGHILSNSCILYTISYFAFNNNVCREAQGIVDWLEKRSGPQWTEVNSKVGKTFEEIIHSLGEKVEEMHWSMVDK